MNSKESIDVVLEGLKPLFNVTEDVLHEWNWESNMQFPVLMEKLAVKMNWVEDDVRLADPLVRYYVRHSPVWHVSRGAGGGIMRTCDKGKRVVNKQVKKKADQNLKAQMRAAIEAQVKSINISVVDGEVSAEFE